MLEVPLLGPTVAVAPFFLLKMPLAVYLSDEGYLKKKKKRRSDPSTRHFKKYIEPLESIKAAPFS